tara:strand:- start:672 stop:1826 length:1155 start_codon:yes stop_codon:yes gene_type:complete
MIFGLPLLGGAALLGTAAFGIAKLAGASTKKALLAGLGVFGGSAALGAMTGAGAAAQTKALASASGAGSLTAAQKSAALQASMGGGTASFMGGAGATGVGGGAVGSGISGAPAFMGGKAAALSQASPGITSGTFTAFDAAGNVVPLGDPATQAISRAGETFVGSVAPQAPSSVGANLAKIPGAIGSFVQENPGAAVAGAAGLGSLALSNRAPVGTVSPGSPEFDDMTGELYQRERERIDPTSERAEYTMAQGALTPANVYERQEEMFAARQGGLATLKLKEGGVNYLPSKSDHDEKDANNYVRAMGYVEDGSGNGDKDEDTMLAQLADGEFVSRADAILGAGIMTGANPDDFKDMRRKGAQFFYKQQDSFKRVYDLVNDRNKAS